ncbi:tyrosine-type recombinase/integrase [Nonomuraea sp. NPDC050383]|uniref:tyrosine-type recombinase/integrase n=1 Tax=Nonomuraea sp. NPDC050383 TaxID=3364362 RepID=UPI0037914500
MPFLFQRKIGASQRAMNSQTIWRVLDRICRSAAETRPEFAGLAFTPHDLRRIFATDLINNGPPIHIGAAVLGHLSTQATRGYVAIFDEDLSRHYQAYLERRGAVRARDEYRPPTDREWTEFEEHFDKRKAELGTCARPYATPCAHEHACIRCPVLQGSPKMPARLDEIQEDLISRRQRAEAERWHGEIEGIDLTMSFLRDKRAHTQRLTRRVHLGLPGLRPSSA